MVAAALEAEVDEFLRLDEERSCILVIMGADEQGRKEVVAVSDGYRESKTEWCELLLELRRRGLTGGRGWRRRTGIGLLGGAAGGVSGNGGTDLLVL